MKQEKSRKSKRIVLTGGHAATTAYAVIQRLKEDKEINWKISWIGASSAMEGKKIPTFESEILPKMGVDCYFLVAGRLQRRFTIWTIPSLLKIPLGFIQAFFYLLAIRPQITLSFGGFAAFPVVFVSWLLNVPVVIHEQTSTVGRANLYSSFFAKKITLSRKESKQYFPKSKIEIVGNPLSLEISRIPSKNRLNLLPTILVTGGSRGSSIINSLIGEILERILEKYKIIHQTGRYEAFVFNRKREGLTPGLKNNYIVIDVAPPWQWAEFLKKADLIVSRAGANSVSEIMKVKIPSILIPIPWAYADEQNQNANMAEVFGISRTLHQKSATAKKLLDLIEETFLNWYKIVESVKNKKSPDENAAPKLIKILKMNVK